MEKKAKQIKVLTGFQGDARLYQLSEPAEFDKPYDEDDAPAKVTQFVVVSAANVMFSGPETYIFPADEEGKIVDWVEMDGSFRGGLDHARALSDAGYSIADF